MKSFSFNCVFYFVILAYFNTVTCRTFVVFVFPPKTIKGNKDAVSIVKYQLQEPFVTKVVRIYPDIDVDTSPVCLRTELYGCDPKPGNKTTFDLFSFFFINLEISSSVP